MTAPPMVFAPATGEGATVVTVPAWAKPKPHTFVERGATSKLTANAPFVVRTRSVLVLSPLLRRPAHPHAP